MPRLEENNPTERIMRVIQSFEIWIKEYDRLRAAVQELEGGVILLVDFQRPSIGEFAREKAFLHTNATKARYYRKRLRGKHIIEEANKANRPELRESPANHRKAAEYAITHGYCLQGADPYTDIEVIICVIEGVGLKIFLDSVRGPNNKKIPINELGLEYVGSVE
jgi:hypothetical protein